MDNLEALAVKVERYDPAQSSDNRADELALHQDIVMLTGLGTLSPAFEATFVRSLDAAKSLTPDGWFIRVTQVRFGMWRVELWRGDKSVKTPPDVEAIASSEERARVAANLRALAAQEDHHG